MVLYPLNEYGSLEEFFLFFCSGSTIYRIVKMSCISYSAAIAKCHRPGCINNRRLFCYSWRLKVQDHAASMAGSSERFSPVFQMSTSSLCLQTTKRDGYQRHIPVVDGEALCCRTPQKMPEIREKRYGEKYQGPCFTQQNPGQGRRNVCQLLGLSLRDSLG